MENVVSSLVVKGLDENVIVCRYADNAIDGHIFGEGINFTDQDSSWSVRAKGDGETPTDAITDAKFKMLGMVDSVEVDSTTKRLVSSTIKGVVDFENEVDLSSVSLRLVEYASYAKSIADAKIRAAELVEEGNMDSPEFEGINESIDTLTEILKSSPSLNVSKEDKIGSIEDAMHYFVANKVGKTGLRDSFSRFNNKLNLDVRDNRKSVIVQSNLGDAADTIIYLSDVPVIEHNSLDGDIVRTVYTSNCILNLDEDWDEVPDIEGFESINDLIDNAKNEHIEFLNDNDFVLSDDLNITGIVVL